MQRRTFKYNPGGTSGETPDENHLFYQTKILKPIFVYSFVSDTNTPKVKQNVCITGEHGTVSGSVVVLYLSVGCLEKVFFLKYLRVFCAVLLNSAYFLTFCVFGSCLSTLASNIVTDLCVVVFCLVLCVF